MEFWTLQMEAFADTLQPMFAEYEQTHPGVKIHWVDVPFSEGPKRTLTALMNADRGHVPDVINLNPDFSAILATRNALIDMRKALPEAVQHSYLPVAWEAASLPLQNPGAASFPPQNARAASLPLQNTGTASFPPQNTGVAGVPLDDSGVALGREQLSHKNNHGTEQKSITFGLPWYVTSSVTLYNKALLKRAGLNSPPRDFDALPAFAERVHTKTGAYGLMPIICENGNFLKELKKMGIPPYDANGRAVFASDLAIAHLARFVEMVEMGWVPKEIITEGHQAAVGRYQAGTLAIFSIGPNFLKIVKENAPEVYANTGVAPQFPADAQFRDFSLMVLVVPQKSVHPKEAVEFAAFVTNADNQLKLARAAPVLPSVTAALENPYFSPVDRRDLMAVGRGISARQLLAATEAYTVKPQQNAINEIVDHYVQLALLGKLNPADALKRAQSEVNALPEQE